MDFMFNQCTSLRELNLLSFNTLNCGSFTSMFTGIQNMKLIVKNNTVDNLVEKIPPTDKIEIEYRN